MKSVTFGLARSNRTTTKKKISIFDRKSLAAKISNLSTLYTQHAVQRIQYFIITIIINYASSRLQL